MSKPYFETKVVKVKKEKRVEVRDNWEYISDKYLKRLKTELAKELKRREKKGNWVNGENLDKIKFPCFCSYGGSQYGMITRTKANEAFDNVFYTLHGIEKQHNSLSSVRSYYNFADLIRVWDIHILKGKIILYEEEK